MTGAGYRPLWKRALWHSVKYLFRKHPMAAISATGAGVGFAGRTLAQEGADFVKDKAAMVEASLHPAPAAQGPPVAALADPAVMDIKDDPPDQPNEPDDAAAKVGPADADRDAFWNSLSPQARHALQKLAAARKDDSG